MPIQVRCPSCRVIRLFGDEYAGLTGKCTDCGAWVPVPAVEKPQPPKPAATTPAGAEPATTPAASTPDGAQPSSSVSTLIRDLIVALEGGS